MGTVRNQTTESSWKEIEEYRERAHDQNHVTKNQFGVGGRFGGCATRNIARQYRDQNHVRDESD